MLKLTGAVLIISAFGLWGFSKSEKLKKRNECLLNIISALAILEKEVSYAQKCMRDALLQIGTLTNIPLFTAVSKNIGTSDMQEVFSSALSSCNMNLSKGDNQTLLEFSQNLGGLDCVSQIKSILHTKELLKMAQNEAYDEYKKYSRLYRSTGILLGVLFSLILL
ncbi:MAG: stage III sporulation protein AB [Clostridia bacterium]|nr:stage III sporulation protein AB [Clostridia bacterium]